ncbi:MAG: hypothetical protein ACI853_000407 [Paracoccaceae bacterium]|jgi:hypothetical protein
MMRPVFFSDLDDTVFQTARKMSDIPHADRLASEALNGSHSYMSGPQAVMMDWLLGSTRFIPVTARSTEALARCKIPFRDFQICSNGAVILRSDRSPDPDWHLAMKEQADQVAGEMKSLISFMATQTVPGRFRYWTVQETGVDFYFCVKSNEGESALDEVDALLEGIACPKLLRHRNGNNLSFTPAGISKRIAVSYLLDKLLDVNDVPVFGMGDSLTDMPFMEMCDMMVIPRNSQIHQVLLSADAQ